MRRTAITVLLVLVSVIGVVPAVGAGPRHAPPSQPDRQWQNWPQDGTTPPLPANSGTGRRVVYSISHQRVWLVDDVPTDHVDRSYLVSGRRTYPATGTYRVFSTSRHTRAGAVRMEYMVRFTKSRRTNVGFHSIPVNRRGVPIQSEAELGQYRSSGCVRQRLSDAAYLWSFAPVGTTVVVTP